MNSLKQFRFWKPAVALALLPFPILLGLASWQMLGASNGDQQAFVFYEVKKADLPIVVTERGTLESQIETTIRCEVENSSFDRSTNGTLILTIVPNGSAVKEGDLLVELDSAAIRERLDSQQLAYDRSVSQRIQAQARYENQLSQNETALARAELDVKLAELNLQMYLDDESGMFKLALEDNERQVEEARNQILEAQASLELQKTNKAGIEALFKLGYRGRSDLTQSRINFMRSEALLAQSVNRLDDLQASRRQLETYERQKQVLTLEGEVETAKRRLAQVELDNTSAEQQALAAKIEAEKAEEKEKERLDKYSEQLVLCKIYAPHDGMVVYSRENSRYGSSTEIEEGVAVRERQQILSLPDLSRMQVKTYIHEAVLDQVRYGLPVTVKIDAFPDRTYRGIVEEVAVVPTSSRYSSISTYECVVRIDEMVEQLKPGMTAVVDIHVDRLDDVLAVPVQAVVQIRGDSWCYVDAGKGVERREVKLGATNDKFVQVKEGLNAGERVVLNPMAIVDETQDRTKIAPDANAEEAPEIDIPPEAPAAAPAKAAAPGDGAAPQKRFPGMRPPGMRPPGKRPVADS